MPAVFGFSDRIKASSARELVLLADGEYYALKASRKELSMSENVQLADLFSRFNQALDAGDINLERHCLEQMGMLIFESAASLALEPLDTAHLLLHVERFFMLDSQRDTPEKPTESAEEADMGLALFQYARAYGQAPVDVYEHTPLWMLDAGLGALPMLRLRESFRRAEEVQLGTGSFKNVRAGSRALIRSWQREARPRQKTRQTGQQFAAMMGGLGVVRS